MGGRNGERGRDGGTIPAFDIVLWGYDRGQVERCLEDMTARLERAFGQLDSVRVLQEQLREAHLEIDQLRQAAEEHPSWADQVSQIMMTAEELRDQARRDAEAIRAGAGAADARSGGGGSGE